MSRRGEANSGVAEPAKGRDVSTVKLGAEVSRSGAADDTAGAGATTLRLTAPGRPPGSASHRGRRAGRRRRVVHHLSVAVEEVRFPSYRHSSS